MGIKVSSQFVPPETDIQCYRRARAVVWLTGSAESQATSRTFRWSSSRTRLPAPLLHCPKPGRGSLMWWCTVFYTHST